MNGFRSERGQALVLSTLFLAAMLGMSALVLDVGSWFREQRDTQRVADAAALAGAQALPFDTSEARSLALKYTAKNGGGSPTISFRTTLRGTDTIDVKLRRDAPGFFSKLFGINSVNVGAKASARAFAPGSARWVAPIVVNHMHPMLVGCDGPCFGPQNETDLELDNLHDPGSGNAAGSFGLISLNDDDLDANTLAEWVVKGYEGYMGIDDYRSAPSANFNNGQFQAALEKRKGTEMLFPIYKKILGSGSTAQY